MMKVCRLLGWLAWSFAPLVLVADGHATRKRSAEIPRGTTRDLKKIFVGRCYDYIRVINPALRDKNCEQMWEAFYNGFKGKQPCEVTMDSYNQFVALASHPLPKDKEIFWSGTNALVHKYSGARLLTLEDSLAGYIANNLNWCPIAGNPDLDYTSCPGYSECDNNAVKSFWIMASKSFAQNVRGVVRVMLNGSREGGAFYSGRESCGVGSVAHLEARLKEHGFKYSCFDNCKSVLHMQCVDLPNIPICQFANNDSSPGNSATMLSSPLNALVARIRRLVVPM
ncbi:ADP-ribosyl cyclase/cyclic ADP-ribose hydrolase 2-like isoform X2 [Petromyzon marinus]|uniref:ADP-ribosyl cyclase/cyclic ADP-ribose hydrolase 2-like isoform X2 n=1 Tax=Petromyzon marinus TaxID=7757 RepID=UPI003F723D6F